MKPIQWEVRKQAQKNVRLATLGNLSLKAFIITHPLWTARKDPKTPAPKISPHPGHKFLDPPLMVRDIPTSHVVHACKVWWSCMKHDLRYGPDKES